jgi:SnoaL-like protein
MTSPQDPLSAGDKTRMEKEHIALIEKYYRGCNARDVDLMMSTFTPDVHHYFYPQAFTPKPVVGAENLARLWAGYPKSQRWTVDHAIASGDEAVIEFSFFYPRPGDKKEGVIRGAEWYVFREGLISEIRAYYWQGPENEYSLQGFPYAERNYSQQNETSL